MFFCVVTVPAHASAVVARQKKMRTMQAEPAEPQATTPRAGGASSSSPVREYYSPQRQIAPGPGSDATDVETVDLKQVWSELEVSSEVWALMIDTYPKERTVERYMRWYQKQGVRFAKSPAEYVRLIDEMVVSNPAFLKNPFKDVIRIVAIIEYDFNNGANKDQMARSVLGEKAFEQNKKRLGLR